MTSERGSEDDKANENDTDDATAEQSSPSAPTAGWLEAGLVRARDALRHSRLPSSGFVFPLAEGLKGYSKDCWSRDLIAGLIVAIMLVPQAMAYAILAGLPSHVGLYASIAPVLIYALFGSSRVLAVGPAAIISLMVASALTPHAVPGSAEYAGLALVFAAMSGLILLFLGFFQFGFIVNFISHPVIAGFTSAAALIIGFSQVRHLIGVDLDNTTSVFAIMHSAIQRFGEINLATVAIAMATLGLLLPRERIAGTCVREGLCSEAVGGYIARGMPLVAAVVATIVVAGFDLSSRAGVKVVGAVPSGLPSFGAPPTLDTGMIRQLLPAAFLISIIGFLESVSVAKSLASKRRQRINANQELVGLGLANLGAAFTGGYPVAGSFSRSAVNFSAGARTPVAALVTLTFVVLTLLFLMPLLYNLPMAVLAAIIIMAAVQLFDIAAFKRSWTYSRTEGICCAVTFTSVLAVDVVNGMIIGIVLSLALHLWRTSRPHIAVVGQLGDGNVFRNVKRFQARTFDGILLLRIDESLYFANANYLEDAVLRFVAERQEITDVVIICTSVNMIDASALDTFEALIRRLRDGGVTLHFAGLKLFLRDRLTRVSFESTLAPGMIFISTEAAVRYLVKST